MTRYYCLFLNPMTGRMEERNAVAVSDNPAVLQRILDECRCEPYQDKGDYYGSEKAWNKSFKKGSELEWFNPPEHCGDGYGIVELGTKEEYLAPIAKQFDEFVNRYFRM